MNLNATGCESKWIKVNQSESTVFHWQEAIDTIESIDATWQWKTNWLTPRKPGLLVQEHPQDQSIHLPHMKMVHFKPSMTPFLVGYLFNWHNWNQVRYVAMKKPLLKQSPCLLIQVVNWATTNMSHVPHCINWNNLSLKMLETNTQRIIDITSAASDDMTHPSLT